MAEKTEAQIAEEKRRKALTQDQRDEEDRRAALSQDERDAEDLAELENRQRAENDAARGNGLNSQPLSGQSREALVKRMQDRAAAKRAKEANVEVTIARGRTVYLDPAQAVPLTGGMTLMVTAEEEETLRRAGHLVNPDKSLTEPVGPRVYQEAGLIEGHGTGQGAKGGKPASGKSK